MKRTVRCNPMHVPHFLYIQVITVVHEKQTNKFKMSYLKIIRNPIRNRIKLINKQLS